MEMPPHDIDMMAGCIHGASHLPVVPSSSRDLVDLVMAYVGINRVNKQLCCILYLWRYNMNLRYFLLLPISPSLEWSILTPLLYNRRNVHCLFPRKVWINERIKFEKLGRVEIIF